jgi:preprotein translocase subunit SecB
MQKKSTFQFVEYFIRKSIFIRRTINNSKKDYSIKITPNGVLNLNNNQFQLSLEIDIIDKQEDTFVNVEIIGLFKFTGDFDEVKNFLYLNAPAILFPYLRAYISTLTTLSGLDTYTLPTMNLSSLKDELEKSIEKLEQ